MPTWMAFIFQLLLAGVHVCLSDGVSLFRLDCETSMQESRKCPVQRTGSALRGRSSNRQG